MSTLDWLFYGVGKLSLIRKRSIRLTRCSYNFKRSRIASNLDIFFYKDYSGKIQNLLLCQKKGLIEHTLHFVVALVSPSTSVPKTENSPKQPVGNSSDLPSYILNSVPYDITSTLATGMNYSALKSPLMTASPLTASYILSTQNGFNETNDSLPTIKRTSSLILATYASHMTYSGQGKTSLSKGRVSLSIKPSQKASTKPSSLLVMSKKRDLPQTVNTETQGFLRTRKWSSSFLQATCASHMTPYPAQGKTFPSITPSLEKSTRPSSTISVSSQEGDLSDTTNLLPSSVKIVPSTAVKELITQTVNSSIEVKNDDFIDKLLRGEC